MSNNSITKLEDGNIVFTEIDRQKFEACEMNILDAQSRAEGLAEIVASNLYIVSQNKLYMLDDYKNVHEWAMDKFGISKGTVSDSINTFARFGDGTTGKLLEKWQDYAFSTLMRIKKYSDEEIAEMGIDATMTRAQVISAIDAHKERLALEAKKPALEKEWLELLSRFYKVVTDSEKRTELINEWCPEMLVKDHEITADEYLKAIALCEAFLDGIEDAEEQENATAEQEIEMDDNSAVEQEVESNDNSTAEHEEQHTMPTKTLNINSFRKDNGELNKKLLLDTLWDMIQKVNISEFDILLTKTE